MHNDNSKLTSATPPATMVYACSGCSDAGEIADRVARQLTREGAAKMSCLAGIGGRVKSLMTTAEKAERILVVDGCPLNCARRTLELAGFTQFDHLELHKLGIRKGSTPVTGDHIADGVAAAKKILSGQDLSPGNAMRLAVCGPRAEARVGAVGGASTAAPEARALPETDQN